MKWPLNCLTDWYNSSVVPQQRELYNITCKDIFRFAIENSTKFSIEEKLFFLGLGKTSDNNHSINLDKVDKVWINNKYLCNIRGEGRPGSSLQQITRQWTQQGNWLPSRFKVLQAAAMLRFSNNKFRSTAVSWNTCGSHFISGCSLETKPIWTECIVA